MDAVTGKGEEKLYRIQQVYVFRKLSSQRRVLESKQNLCLSRLFPEKMS